MTLSQGNRLYGELKRLYHGNIDFLMYRNQIDDGICLYPRELDIFCRSIIQFHNSPKYQNKMITLQMTFADCVYYTLSKIDEGTSLRKVSMTTKLRLLMAKMIYGYDEHRQVFVTLFEDIEPIRMLYNQNIMDLVSSINCVSAENTENIYKDLTGQIRRYIEESVLYSSNTGRYLDMYNTQIKLFNYKHGA